jgi:hypothetical protein
MLEDTFDVVGFGADPTGVASSTQAFRDADAAAAAVGGVVSIPEGTFKLTDIFYSTNGNGPTASWIGAGKENTVLQFDVSGGGPRLIVAGYNTLPRPEPLQTATPTRDLAKLADQTSLVGRVTLADPVTDGSKFAEGDWVYISCGINIFDADDELWRYTYMTRIVDYNAGTGVALLADAPEEPLTDDGWAAGGLKDAAADWANTTSYTIGDFVYDSTSLYEATSTGVSSGTGVADDVGVSWIRRTGALNALRGLRDGSVVMQKAPDPRAFLTFRDFTIESINAIEAHTACGFRTAYGCDFTDVVIKGNVGNACQVAETCTNIKLERVYDQSDRDGTSQTSLWTYSARRTLVNQCHFRGAANGGSGDGKNVIRIESNAQVDIRDTVLTVVDRTSGGPRAIFLDYGRMSAIGCTFLGTHQPITYNQANDGIIPDRLDLHRLAHIDAFEGNFVDMRATGFRRLDTSFGPNQIMQVYNERNKYRLWGGYSDLYTQTNPLIFEPTRRVTVTVSFTPSVSQSNTVVPWPVAPSGIMDMSDIRAVFLGAQVIWDSPSASGTVDVEVKAKVGGNERSLLSPITANNEIRVSDTAPTAQRFDGQGSNSRLIDNTIAEELFVNYDSNGSANSGTIYVLVHLLVEDGFDGDFSL